MEVAWFIVFACTFRLLLLSDPSLPFYFGPKCPQQRDRLIRRHTGASAFAFLVLTLTWVLR